MGNLAGVVGNYMMCGKSTLLVTELCQRTAFFSITGITGHLNKSSFSVVVGVKPHQSSFKSTGKREIIKRKKKHFEMLFLLQRTLSWGNKRQKWVEKKVVSPSHTKMGEIMVPFNADRNNPGELTRYPTNS